VHRSIDADSPEESSIQCANSAIEMHTKLSAGHGRLRVRFAEAPSHRVIIFRDAKKLNGDL
jgi:hypothetical protein